jgi:hypothetical protein
VRREEGGGRREEGGRWREEGGGRKGEGVGVAVLCRLEAEHCRATALQTEYQYRSGVLRLPSRHY